MSENGINIILPCTVRHQLIYACLNAVLKHIDFKPENNAFDLKEIYFCHAIFKLV